MGSLLEPKQKQNELGSAEADEESIALLRELVERLSTKDGKTISWSTLVKILEEQDPSKSEDLGRCLSDGCRVIRELPTRSLPAEVKEGKPRASFRFKVPYSMRCIPDIDVGLPQVRDNDASSPIKLSQKPSSTNSSNDGKSGGRGNTINKKRKSLREQSYSRSEVALKDDTVHEEGLGCEDEEVEEEELSDEDQHDFDANIHGDCERSACGSYTCEDEDGMHSYSSERRRGSGWHRCQGVWQPFSHTHKAKRRLAIQTRLRARQFLKSKREREKEEKELLDSTSSSSAAARVAIVPEVDKKGSGRKPSRVERRTAALRKESANAKGKPSLAELRARNGKAATPAVAAAAAAAAGAKEVKKTEGTTTTATAVGHHDPPPPPASAPSKNKPSAPTCSFTFTSRSMAANRLVVMRAELNHLRRNLEEARKEFHDLQRQESQASQQRLVEGGGPSLTDDSVLRAANTLHDRLTNSANALSALSSQAAQTQAQAQLLAQAPSPTQTAMVRPQALTKERKQEAAAAAAAVTHSSHAKEDDVGKGLKGQYVQTSTGDRVFVTDGGKVIPCGADEQGKTQGTWKLVGKIPLPMPCPHTSKREPLSAAMTNVNGGLVSGLVEGVSIGVSPEQSPRLSRTISSKTPSPPPPPSQPLSQPHLQQQQKSPPPLSRRKKANMANIHHISNHKPRRQVKEAQSGVSISQSNSQHDDSIPPGLDHPTSTTMLFTDEWMCVFCEYKLLYGEYPRMMGAIKSRKKLVAQKKEAQDRAHRATTVGAGSSAHSRAQCTCGRAHARALDYVAKEFGMDDNSSKKADHDHDHHHHHHHHHNHDHDHGGDHQHSHHHNHDHEHDRDRPRLGEGTTCSSHKQKPITAQKSSNSTSTIGSNTQHRSPPPQKFTYETATMKFEVEEVQDLAQLSRFHALSTAATSSPATTTKTTARSTPITKASTTTSTPSSSSSSTKHLIRS